MRGEPHDGDRDSKGLKLRVEVVSMKHGRLRAALDRGYEDVAAGCVIQPASDDGINGLFAGL